MTGKPLKRILAMICMASMVLAVAGCAEANATAPSERRQTQDQFLLSNSIALAELIVEKASSQVYLSMIGGYAYEDAIGRYAAIDSASPTTAYVLSLTDEQALELLRVFTADDDFDQLLAAINAMPDKLRNEVWRLFSARIPSLWMTHSTSAQDVALSAMLQSGSDIRAHGDFSGVTYVLLMYGEQCVCVAFDKLAPSQSDYPGAVYVSAAPLFITDEDIDMLTTGKKLGHLNAIGASLRTLSPSDIAAMLSEGE